MKSIGVLMANTFVDKRKKYGKEDGGSVNPIRPCVDEYQFSPTSLETTFFQPGCQHQRKAKRGIINNLPRPQNFPHPMGPPATSFVLLTNPVAVFLIHCLSQKRSFCPNMQSRVRTDAPEDPWWERAVGIVAKRRWILIMIGFPILAERLISLFMALPTFEK